MNSKKDPSILLRCSLMGNAVFSCVSAISFLIFHRVIADFIGLEQPLVLLIAGISLLIFAGGLFRNAARDSPNLKEAAVAVSLDLSWVVGSVAILMLNLLSRQGNWAVVVIADVVLAFAILQWVGLRHLRASATHSMAHSQ